MGAFIAILAVFIWVALMWLIWIRPVVDATRRPRYAYHAAGRTRGSTIWLILLAGWIGGVYYLLRIRPELIAAERRAGSDTLPASSNALPASSGTLPASDVVGSGRPPHRPVDSVDRELFIRNIPPEMIATDTIRPGSAFPPLRFGRQDVVDAVLELDPSADTSQPPRITVALPDLKVAISFPLEDPLTQVIIRIVQSDREVADRFIGQLLDKLDTRAFDTGSATLVFSPTT